jgi:hypothetical protein
MMYMSYNLLFVSDAAGVGSFQANGHCHDTSNSDSKMQRVWNLGADGSVGDPLLAGDLTFQLDGCSDGGSRRTGRTDDGDQGGPRTRGGEVQEEDPQHGGPQEEVFLVGQWRAQGGTTWVPHRHGGGGQCRPQGSEEH